VLRMTIIGGSFVLAEFSRFLARANEKVPYLDLQYDPDAKKLTITSQGSIRNVGVHGVTGWQATWNGKAAAGTPLPNAEGISSFTVPAQ